MANILVVDDDHDLLKLVQTVLSRAGHTLTLATDGEEALAATETQRFDLAVLDVMMPAMDGYELTRRLRANERTRDLAILVLTARTQVADQMSAAEAGADGYLGKPLSYKDLTDKVRQLLDARAAKTAPATPASPVPATPEQGRVFDMHTTPAGPVASIANTQPAVPYAASNYELPQTCRIIVTLGLRGGVGTTTLATNLAAHLMRSGRRTCLVDLSPNGGQVAMQLYLRPNHTWMDWPAAPSSKLVGQTLMRHPSGLFVLPAPLQPTRHTLSGDNLQAALWVLTSFFSDIILDAAPVLDDSTVAAVAAARHTLIVFNAESSAVRTAMGTVRALANLSIPFASLRLVHNHTTPEPGLTPPEVEKLLGRTPDWTVPYDQAQAAALTQGTPLALVHTNGPLATAVANIACEL